MTNIIKKVCSAVCTVVICIPIVCTPLLAAEEVSLQEMDSFKEAAFQDKNVMKSMEVAKDALKISNSETGEEISLDAYVSPEYKVIDVKDSLIVPQSMVPSAEKELYAVDMVAEVTKGDLSEIGARYTNESTDESWLNDSSVKLWGRFFYERNGNTVLVTRVTGNWRNYESGRQYISFQSAQASCCDEYVMWQVTDYSPNGGFTYDTGYTNYVYTTPETMMTRIGLAQHLEIQRYAGDGTYWLSLYVAPWGWNW